MTNAKLINPFIKGVYNCMETMVGIKPVRLAPYLKGGSLATGDITGIIGFAGKNINGSIGLSFPTETALMIYNLVMNENENRLTLELMDLTGELANIVAGGAKKVFAEAGLSFHISIPTIIVGKEHTIHHQFSTSAVIIPFRLNEHSFLIEISIKVNEEIQ